MWHVFGLPIRAYALCIVLGIVVACLVTEVRLRRRGVAPWAVLDMAVWVVPFGIIGARLYHVITSPQAYFGDGGTPIRAFYIWEGGLGIWGGVAGGALGAWFAARQLGLPLTIFADAVAPGLPLAQAIGRLGNWFNNELYGRVTTLPWGLQVHDMDRENPGRAVVIDGEPVVLPDLYHPTFLYEAVWNVGVALLVWALDRRFRFGRGRAFALYVMGYTVGRFWIELLRTDEANTFFGIRLNVFTALLVFLCALAYFLRVRGTREFVVPIDAPESAVPDTAPDDISQVDVSSSGKRPAAVPPPGYQRVSEERFEAYRRTGVLAPDGALPDGALPDGAVTGSDVSSGGSPTGSEPVRTGGSTVLTRPATAESAVAAPAAVTAESEPARTTPLRSDFAKPQPVAQPEVAQPEVAQPEVAKPGVATQDLATKDAAEPRSGPASTTDEQR